MRFDTEIKIWKPNLFQRFMYWIGLMKDPRYNGKKMNFHHFDEVSHRDLREPNRKAIDLIMLLEANYNLRYVQCPEGGDSADYPKRVLKGEGFADALKIVRDFYGG